MAEYEDSPEQGSLGGPIKRPKEPAIKIHGGDGKSHDGENVSGDIAHGSQRTLYPTMLRNGRPYISDLERWLCARIKPFVSVRIATLVHSDNHRRRKRESFEGCFSLSLKLCGLWVKCGEERVWCTLLGYVWFDFI